MDGGLVRRNGWPLTGQRISGGFVFGVNLSAAHRQLALHLVKLLFRISFLEKVF